MSPGATKYMFLDARSAAIFRSVSPDEHIDIVPIIESSQLDFSVLAYLLFTACKVNISIGSDLTNLDSLSQPECSLQETSIR